MPWPMMYGAMATNGSTFSPTSISGLQLWFKADAGLYQDAAGTTPAASENDAVGLWQDQSGNHNHATQETANRRPVLKFNVAPSGLSCLRFDGSLSNLIVGDVDELDGLSGLTIFVAGYALGNNQMFIAKHSSGSTGSWYVARVENESMFVTINESISRQDLGSIPAPDALGWLSARYSSENNRAESWDRGEFYDSLVQTGNLQAVNSAIRIGTYNTLPAWALNGDIFEIAVFSEAVSDENMALLNEYFRVRLGFPPPAFDNFTYVGVSDADLHTSQGVATDGAGTFWGSGGQFNNQWLFKYSKSGDTYTEITSRDTASDWPAGMTQVNGLYFDGSVLYVGGNNYNTTPAAGWILEYDPDDLTLLDTHTVRGAWCEGGAIGPNGNFFITYDNSIYIDEYEMATWTLVRAHDSRTPVGVSGHGYQGGSWQGDYFFSMAHEGENPLKCDVWLWDATTEKLTFVQRLDPPTPQCTQDICVDPIDDTVMWWVERYHGGSPANDHRIVQSTIVPL